MPGSGTPEQFRIHVPQADLDDLKDRLTRTRWTEDFNNDDWRYGTNGSYLRELVGYWIDGYDWRAAEAAMNAYQNYRVTIDDVVIHYLRAQGRGRRVVPLILTHGWPWTFWDFSAVIGPLSDPAAHGLDDSLAFDVIVPSLPGFGFSSPLRRSGLSPAEIARLWHTLMTDVLGYPRYVAHGGDQGSFVTANLAHEFADSLIGAHLTLPALLGVDFAANTAGRRVVEPEDYGPGEENWYENWTRRAMTTRVHSLAHRVDPQSLGWAFNDSPAGLASWLVQRRRNWSDCGGDVERVFSKDSLLTLVSIYWHTQTITTSMRSYAELGLDQWKPVHDRKPTLQAPVGMAVFPQDVLLLPRTMVAKHANLVHWTVMPRGGHFAPAEQPALLAADITAFVRSLTAR